jgi:hypothetical protein
MDHSKDSAVQHYSDLEVVSHLKPEADQVVYPGIVQGPEVVRSCWRRKWVWFIVFGVVVISAIVGGVVGGVVVQRHPDVLPTQTALVAQETPLSLQLIN